MTDLSNSNLEKLLAEATKGPWEFDGVCQIVEAARPHMRVCFLPSDHAEYATSEPNGELIALTPDLAAEVLRLWEFEGAALDEIWCLREVIRGVRIMSHSGALKDFADEPWLKRILNIDIDTGFARAALDHQDHSS